MAIAAPPIRAGKPRKATAASKRISAGIARKGTKKKSAKKGRKKAGKKKAAKKSPRRGKKKGAKKAGKKKVRRRRRGQKGPNVISHKDSTGLGKGRVKCPPSKTAVATVAKHRKSGTYVFYGRCV